MSGYLQPLKTAATAASALATTVTVAAAWVMLSSNSNVQWRSAIEPATFAHGAADFQGQSQDLTIPAGAVDVTFEARWARATVSTTSVDLTLVRTTDMNFESRWAQATGRAVSLVVSDDRARRETTSDSIATQVVMLNSAAALPPANSVPLPLARVSQQARSMRLPQPHSAQYEAARALASKPPLQVATATPRPLSFAPDKRATPLEATNKLKSLPGWGSRTAVYDISAHTVYLPNGERLEAHSGLGDKIDDPRYVNIRMRGPTPPNVYYLTLREKLFHGVRAIRLNPVDDDKMFGRAGMLAHTYMLGANGQSNGCVSLRDYPKFLQAFLSGEVDRLVVVPDLETKPSRTARARRRHILRYALNSR